jgi:plastocyanin
MLKDKLITFVLLLMLVAAGLVACQTSGATATPAEVNVIVTASDYKYEPATLTVRAGQTLHLTFKNASTTLVHEFRIKELKVETKAGPGLEYTQTFVAAVPGTYKFTCNIPGHEGMVGELIVQ